MTLTFWTILAVLLLVPMVADQASAQSSHCLKLVCVDGEFDSSLHATCANENEVKIDSCPSSSTYKQFFGNRWFEIVFQYYAIDLPFAPADTIMEVGWEAIDTSFETLRSAFATLEAKYGEFYLKKYAPNWVDSADEISKVYQIRLDNYVCIDSFLFDLRHIPGVSEVEFHGYPAMMLDVSKPGQSADVVTVRPNPAHTLVEVSINQGVMERISVYDMQGHLLRSYDLAPSTASYLIELAGLPSGKYLIRINGSISKEFLIVK